MNRRWVCETLHAEGHSRGQAAAATQGAAAEAEAAAASDSLQASLALLLKDAKTPNTESLT